ncbi:hypothetical protein HID58_013842 [Brassica napus]|uniref:(rape) hypothetical protein n=1 Tax=Brassica napus TaxID=3708 RepID=A0A817AKS0_BRANA|nr:uncharacterized protein LOC125608405 [Brassica napus]KAH0928115.1 hypothetical protein HID58_013842 [Brassica napus]CAF2263950.1 unnamed protein product [Brassica napus]
MSIGMIPRQAKLIVSFMFWGFLVLSSATEDLVVITQCKNQCKHDLHNMKECEDRCHKKMMMMMDQRWPQRRGFDGVDDEALQTKCNRKCTSSYTPRKRCISQCFRSMVGKKIMDNEVICESSCTILQEKPLIVRCTRVCHESTPGAVGLVLLEKENL